MRNFVEQTATPEHPLKNRVKFFVQGGSDEVDRCFSVCHHLAVTFSNFFLITEIVLLDSKT